jgi:hypothetical protein
MKYYRLIIVFLFLWLGCSMPVMGVTTYLGGSPRMSAAISGVNEFTPGQDATIKVIVQNSGVDSLKFVMIGNIERDDLPTTAKMVTVELGSGSAPVVIKSDPQRVGDINGNITSSGVFTVSILAKILSNATQGEYQLPLTIRYTYLASSSQDASDILQSDYQQRIETFPITIKIKPQVKIEVLEAVPENLNVGSEGFLNLKIKNAGSEDGRKATAKIIRNGASPIIPTDSSVFIGDFPHNGTVTCRYKVAISSEAEKQTYPVDVVVMYENRDGDVVTSASDTLGIPVGGKISFTLTSGTVQVVQGSQNVIEVKYQNSGTAIAYNAQARLSAVEPFKSTDDTSYLGDLKPGETATARYQMSADDAAVVKDYTLESEVRYRDALDNSQVSDTFNVPVKVQPKPASNGFMQVLTAIGIIALICIGAGYYVLVMRKKK